MPGTLQSLRENPVGRKGMAFQSLQETLFLSFRTESAEAGISLFLGFCRSEIPRFVRNDAEGALDTCAFLRQGNPLLFSLLSY